MQVGTPTYLSSVVRRGGGRAGARLSGVVRGGGGVSGWSGSRDNGGRNRCSGSRRSSDVS